MLQPIVDALKGHLDGFVASVLASMHAAMLPAGAAIILLAVTVFFIMVMAGVALETPTIVKNLLVLIGAVTLLRLPGYLSDLIIVPLIHFMEGTSSLLISSAGGGGGGTNGLIATYEEYFWTVLRSIGNILKDLNGIENIGKMLAVSVLAIPFIIIMSVLFIYLFEAYIVFAVWQVLSPIFILAFMWKATRGIAVSSFRWLFQVTLSVILISAIAAILVFMINDLLDRMPITGGLFNDNAEKFVFGDDFWAMMIVAWLSVFLMRKCSMWASNLAQFFDGGGTVGAAVSGTAAAASGTLSAGRAAMGTVGAVGQLGRAGVNAASNALARARGGGTSSSSGSSGSSASRPTSPPTPPPPPPAPSRTDGYNLPYQIMKSPNPGEQ